MSDFSNGNEVITSSEHSITIEKSFDGEEFAVPTIRFEIRSGCDEAVTVRVTDRIPEDFPMDNVGFHPEYENENWTAYKDHRVQFERTLEPDEELTTVYGIRLSDWQEAESFLIEPSLEEVAPVASGVGGEAEGRMEEHTITDIVSEDSSQVVRDVIAGDSGLPGLGGDGEAADPLADANEPLAETTDDVLDKPDDGILEPPEEEDAVDVTQSPSPPRPGSVAAALADEIRAGEVNDADLKLIQQELDTPESTNVRIRHLQFRVDDLSAYTEALEEFIDENGTAQSIIDGFEDEVESLRGELETMHDDIESAKDEGAQARARVADLESDLSDLDGVNNLDDNLDTLEMQLNDLEDLVATNTQEASALDDEIEDLRDDFDSVKDLEEKVENLSEIEALSETVSDLSDSVSETESQLNAKINTLRSDIGDVESDLNEIESFQSDMSEMEDEMEEFRE